MNFADFITYITGFVQFAVAAYALRLNRLFGVARVGWSLFWAFSLLALLHLVQALIPDGVVNAAVTVSVLYSLISLLLLVSMVHLESLLRERARVEREEKRLRAELEWEVQKKTAHLTRAIEELTAEIEGRKQAEAEVETTQLELQAVSRKLESAEITASVLRSVGNMLKSVNASTGVVSDQVKQSKIANVVHIGTLIRDHSADLGTFMTQDPLGRKLPVYIAELGRQLAGERATLTTELESMRLNLEHIKDVLAMHQKCANLASLNETLTVTSAAGEARSANFVPAT